MQTLLFYHTFFLLFLIIDAYLVIPAVIAQILNHTAELAILKKIPNREAKSEMVVETKMFNVI